MQWYSQYSVHEQCKHWDKENWPSAGNGWDKREQEKMLCLIGHRRSGGTHCNVARRMVTIARAYSTARKPLFDSARFGEGTRYRCCGSKSNIFPLCLRLEEAQLHFAQILLLFGCCERVDVATKRAPIYRLGLDPEEVSLRLVRTGSRFGCCESGEVWQRVFQSSVCFPLRMDDSQRSLRHVRSGQWSDTSIQCSKHSMQKTWPQSVWTAIPVMLNSSSSSSSSTSVLSSSSSSSL